MADTLPHGLVSNTDCVSSDLKSADHVEIEDVAKLWRVYTTNKITLKQGAGQRLENLFWRIWSNGRISSKIRGSTLARLFIQMTDESPLWARNREELGRYPQISLPNPPGRPSRSRNSLTSIEDNPHAQLARTDSSNSNQGNMPPSILKKPSRSSSQNPRKSARFTFGTLGETEIQPGSTRYYNLLHERIPDEPQYPTGPQSGLPLSQLQGLPDSKGQWNFPVRRSTLIGETGQLPEDFSPRTTTDPELYRQARSALGPPPPEDPLSDSSSESPTSHGRQLTPTGGPSLPEIRPQISAPKQIEPLPTTPLVEKDFRARFVDRRPRESRVSSLTSLISSEESFSLSISPVHGDSLAGMRPGLQSRRITTSSSSPPLHELFSNRRPPEVLLSRTLSGSSSRLSSRGGGCLRLKDRQGQESQLSKLIEEEKKIADE